MNNSFSFTDTAGTVHTLTFDTKGHMADDADALVFYDELSQTPNGTDIVRDYGAGKDTFSFSAVFPKFKTGTESDLADVKAFLGLVRRLNTFTWTDENGTVRTVRNLTNPIQFAPLGGRWYKVSLELKAQ